jgi:diguanylate cyclase (GGDEF)-like protein
MLRQIADRLLRELDPEDEVARIGADEFAVLTFAQGTDEAARLATSLQQSLAHAGYTVTFGWAAFPQDGTNALSLYRAADERLYARKIVLRDRATVVPLHERAADARRP